MQTRMACHKQKADVVYYKTPSTCKKGTAIVGYKTMYGDWFDLHTKTKPIAYSTVATRDWLHILHEESSSWQEMLAKADGSSGEYIKDLEAVEVIKAYMKYDTPYKDMLF